MTEYYESSDAWFDANGIGDYDYDYMFASYIDGHLAECFQYGQKEVWFILEVQGWRLVDTKIELNALLNSGEVV